MPLPAPLPRRSSCLSLYEVLSSREASLSTLLSLRVSLASLCHTCASPGCAGSPAQALRGRAGVLDGECHLKQGAPSDEGARRPWSWSHVPLFLEDVAQPDLHNQNSSTVLRLPRQVFPVENEDSHMFPDGGLEADNLWGCLTTHQALPLDWTLAVGDWPGQRTSLLVCPLQGL